MTKTSEPSNSAASSSAAHITEIESHRLSLLWIMNPAPQPAAGHYSRNAILSVESRTPFSDRGVLLKEHRGILASGLLLFREWPWGRRIRLRTAFSVSGLPVSGPTRSSGLPWTRAEAPNRWPLMRAISVDRMSYKDASTKQTQDYSDFNHFGAPISNG
jgi:hypothetical protein